MAKHGAPDFYQYRRESFSHPVADHAELAARLGSPNRYERRGDVILQESFEDGLARWTPATSGTGASVDHVTTIYRTGGYACALTAGSDADRYARIIHSQHLPSLAPLGFEAHLTPDPDSESGELRLRGVRYTFTYEWAVRFDATTFTIYYLDDAGGWSTLTSWPGFYTVHPMFYSFKLVVDLDTGYYVRLIAGAQVIDMSNLAAYQYASAVAVHLEAHCTHFAQAGTNPVANIDDVIITTSEPS